MKARVLGGKQILTLAAVLRQEPILVLVPSIRLGPNCKYFIEMMTSENVPEEINICASFSSQAFKKLWKGTVLTMTVA